MIALLAGIAIQSSQTVEWLEPDANVVTIQAVVKLPNLDERQFNILRLIVANLGKNTKTYSEAQIADIGARAGSRMRATTMTDHIRVSFDVLPPDADTGISMIGWVLREPTVRPEELQAVADDLQFRRMNYWRSALDGRDFNPPKYSAADLQSVTDAVFRPENVTLGVGGKITPGAATKKWDSITSAWKTTRVPTESTPAVMGAATIKGGLTVVEFRGASFPAGDAALSTRLLALTALGTGKGSSLWRVAREDRSLSYRQESMLYPTIDGFMGRLLIATANSERVEEWSAELKSSLLADVAKWTEVDRRRAIGMAESYLVNGGDMSPLYFAVGRPLDRGLSDRVFLKAYWKAKTGGIWNPYQFVGRLGFVELSALKEAATAFLTEAKLVVHRSK